MRRNVAPIREPVFDAHVEIKQRDGRVLKLPIVFDRTTRPWTQFFANLTGQAASGSEAEIAEDLFAGISPVPPSAGTSEQDLFGNLPSASRELSSLARHFLFMGA